MDIKIYTVFHKDYWCPEDELYQPIQVGFSSDLNISNIVRDDTEDNISDKNKTFCELTALYWIWKNEHHDYIGLDHYRRHFSKGKKKDKKARVISKEGIIPCLSPDLVILPKKRHYWIETNYSQYAHAHNEKDLILTKNIIQDLCPDYLPSFDKIMKKTCGHRFNMMVMPYSIFDDYCSWLFSILFKLEDLLDISTYSAYDARVFGFVSERLLDVYIDKNAIKVKELDYVFMDEEHWGKKIFKFLKRKFLKY